MTQFAQYAKAITGALVAGLTALIAAFGPDSDGGKVAAILLAVVVASGAVWAVPNGASTGPGRRRKLLDVPLTEEPDVGTQA